MKELHSFKVLPPRIHVLVCKGHCVNFVRVHKRVRASVCTMHIEFFLQKCVYRNIERERWAARTSRSELIVEIEAARALIEKFDLGARKAPLRAAIVPVFRAIRIVFLEF